MKKHGCVIAISFVLAMFGMGSAHAADASALLSPSLYEELKQKGALLKTYYKQPTVKPALVPNTAFAKKIAASWTGAEKPVFVAENLYLLPKSQLSSNPETVTIEKASKILRSIRTIQGIKYYSKSDKKWMTLYKEAYSIKGPNDRTQVADDTEGSADGKVRYCMLNDNSFGKTNYKLMYSQTAEEIAADFVSTSAMYVGPVKAVDAGNLRISLCVIDCGDSLMVYMIVQAKFPALSLLEDTMTDSFTARLNAIYSWFTGSFK